MVNWQEYSLSIESLTEEEKMYIKLVSAITIARIDKGLTQKELAEISGLSQPAIAKFEDVSKTSNSMTILKILNVLGYEITIKPAEK